MIPGRSNRKWAIRYDKKRYKERWRIEALFCRLKGFRRVATRYDKLVRKLPVGSPHRCRSRLLPLNESEP